MSREIMQLQGICKSYKTENGEVKALDNVELTVCEGEFAAIVGKSGAGKSTLMNILGCLDTDCSGEYFLDGENVADFCDGKLSEIRNQKIGFVFQSFNLIPTLTAAENVELPLIYRGIERKKRREAVECAMKQMGLSDRRSHYPWQLSGGQQQRVAIARAIAAKPQIILADEPTGNLDPESREEILGVLLSLWREGRTLVLITHSSEIAKIAPRTIIMEGGKLKDASCERLQC
ncbi:MAG: ABC transporter ATP-binding protein [Oscillospiraceae bacterium]|nr:ABC transporter ATP-binding protein [Oscillospiraceae bacterium]